MPGTHYWQAFFTKQQTREPWQRMPCVMGPGKKWTYTTIWEYKNVKTIYENTLNINVTAPTWEGDLNCSKWGPDFEWNGDQKILTWILFKMYFQPVLTSNFWKAEGRLELEPASAFSDKREDPKISALRLKQTVDGAFLQSKTTYEVSLALLDQTVKWRKFMIS